MKNSPLITLFRYCYSILIGGTITLVLFTNHDLTWWRLGLAVLAALVAGAVLAVLELAIREAMGDN